MTDTTTDTLVRTFAAKFTGTTVTQDHPDYETARATWNAMTSRRPAIVALCQTTADVVAAVNLARSSDLPLAVRAGGHSAAGLSTCDGGIVIDLSPMRTVHVDPARRLAMCGGGTRWHDFDAATAEHGLATTGGLISTTGVAGLTLGGGIGWLQRRYGLACDNLVGAELVTAAGNVVNVNEDTHPGLLWGLRGGGGNFGIVTRFDFRVHPVDTIVGGMLGFPIARGREVLAAYRDWAAGLPDEWTTVATMITAPPAPFVPPELVGQKVLAIAGCYCGAIGAGMASLDPLRALSPGVDVFGPMPYPAIQTMLDASAPAGLRGYFRSGNAASLTDEIIDIALDYGAGMTSPLSQFHLHQMGGAVGRVAPDATAFSAGRTAGWIYHAVSLWADAADDDREKAANRAVINTLAPLSDALSYVNFSSEADDARARAVYGDATYQRLAQLKREWDPTNLFRINQNIQPAR